MAVTPLLSNLGNCLLTENTKTPTSKTPEVVRNTLENYLVSIPILPDGVYPAILPAVGTKKIYVRSNGKLYSYDSNGKEEAFICGTGTSEFTYILPFELGESDVLDYLQIDEKVSGDSFSAQELNLIVAKINELIDLNAGHYADKNYVYEQGTPSSVWNVTHNLNKYPSVVVIDSAGTQVEGGVEYLDVNSVRITFSSAFSGKATLN